MAEQGGTFARVWSAGLALVVVIPAMVYSVYTAAAVCAVAAWLSLREFYGMVLPVERGPLTVVASAFVLPLLGLAACTGAWATAWVLMPVPMGLAVVFGLTWVLLTATSTEGLGARAAALLAGIVYVGGTVVFLPLLYAWGETRHPYLGLKWVWLALAVPWAADTGAYFAGRAWGRHKMAPLISPKKSWEGLVGGVCAAMVAAVVYRWATGFDVLSGTGAALFGALGATAGVFGDLVESMIKRSYGVKDSGVFLPGHGGILDRIDSVLFTMPLAFVYAVLNDSLTR